MDVQPRNSDSRKNPTREYWHETAPVHFDARVPWWAKLLLMAALTLLALWFVDQPVTAWTLANQPLRDGGAWKLKGDVRRELAMLEQWGQWVCSVLVIAAVALIDRAGPRRALAISIGCFLTVMATYLLKDLCGRTRPDVIGGGTWLFGGPAKGFSEGSKWGSFPSAHTTGAFALSVGLSWFYPRARALFMTLATITAVQRVLNSMHFVSDVLAGLGMSVLITRTTFQARLAGRLIALMPPPLREFFLKDWQPTEPGD